MFVLKLKRFAVEIYLSQKALSQKLAGKFTQILAKKILAVLLTIFTDIRKFTTLLLLKNDRDLTFQLFKLALNKIIHHLILKQSIIYNKNSNIYSKPNSMRGFHSSMTTMRANDSKISPRFATQRLVAENNHEVNDYGMLNKAVNNHLKKKKKKKAQVFSDCQSHCKSLDKLQLMNVEKNEEIKRHIYQKAQIHAYNEQLKQMISNPTLRQHQLHMRINQLQIINKRLSEQLQKKDRDHKQQIQRIKNQHKTQIQLINEGYKSRNQIYNYHPTKTPQIIPDKYTNVRVIQPKILEPQNNRINNQYKSHIQTFQTVKSQNQHQHQQNVQFPKENRTQVVDNYVVGSPVYISAHKQSNQKINPINIRQNSPNNSKNTSQTREIRGQSPRIINANNIGTIQKSYEPTRISSPQNRQNKYESFEIRNYNADKSLQINKTSQNTNKIDYQPPLPNSNFAESDLQAIYKKYCIND